MHTVVFYIATIWIGLLFGISVVLMIRVPFIARILVLDTLNLILIALLTLFATANRTAYYLDAALLLALLSFGGTLAAARYHSEGKVFS